MLSVENKKPDVASSLKISGKVEPKCFSEIRGAGSPCVDQITYVVELPIVRQAWPKEGKSVLTCRDVERLKKLRIGEEVVFQGPDLAKL